jgi:hypothetical protein
LGGRVGWRGECFLAFSESFKMLPERGRGNTEYLGYASCYILTITSFFKNPFKFQFSPNSDGAVFEK